MKQIQIDRQKRITLLKWLRDGYVDRLEYNSLLSNDEQLTDDDLEQTIEELVKKTGIENCRRCRRLGLCELEKEPRSTKASSSSRKRTPQKSPK